ncbi:hypothetical protein JQM84_03715 [Parabacteroides distasonis]|nr:hypothetical protein [Parabacteroides distasonis]
MLLLGWVLFSGLLLTIVAKNAVAKHEAANRWSQPGYSDLLAEHEECVTEEECWEAEEEPDEYQEEYDEPYEEEYIEEHPYGYQELYADDPEPSYPEDTYDSYSDCDDYRREVTDEERW